MGIRQEKKNMETEQEKLPLELTDGATVSPLTADEWFTRKRPDRIPVTETDPSAQTSLEQFTGEGERKTRGTHEVGSERNE
jgi:hypothetical protein